MSLHDLDSFKTALCERGFRMTAQRKRVLRIFQDLPQGNHLSAEEIKTSLQQEGKQISLATVYRTLHLMRQMGVLRELELTEGRKHYELNLPSPDTHHHLVCLQCNRTLEFKNERVLKIAANQAQTYGYQILDCQLILRVLCPEASKRGSESRSPADWSCNRDYPS